MNGTRLTYRRFARDPLTFLPDLQAAQGEIAQVRFGRTTFVLVSEPAAVKTVLEGRPPDWLQAILLHKSSRRKPPAPVVSVFPRTDEDRLDVRRTLQPAFRRQHSESQWVETLELSDAAFGAFGNTVDVLDALQRHALTLALEHLFGGLQPPSREEFEKAFHHLVEVWSDTTTPVRDALEWVRLPRLLKTAAAIRTLQETLLGMLAARGEAGEPGDDVLSLLRTRLGDVDPSELVSTMRIVALSAIDGVPITVAWALYLLARHPGYLAAVRDEALHAREGDTPPLPSEAPYLWGAINETLRLYPPVWSVRRMNAFATELGGVPIQQGSYCWAAPWVMHRLEEYWPEPEAFRPERWFGAPTWPRHAYIPFGAAARQCIGRDFALQHILAQVVSFVSRYDFTLPDSRPVAPRAQMTLRPSRPIELALKPRSRPAQRRSTSVATAPV